MLPGALQNGAAILDILETRTTRLLVMLITEYQAHSWADLQWWEVHFDFHKNR
jgi:hypothetical protein